MNDHLPLPEPEKNHLLAVTVDDVRDVAELLVARGLRAEALALVADALEVLEDPRGQLLLARMHLDAGTRAGAEEAATILGFLRTCGRGDLESATLMRRALRELGRHREVAKLDRDVSWTSVTPRRRTTSRPQS